MPICLILASTFGRGVLISEEGKLIVIFITTKNKKLVLFKKAQQKLYINTISCRLIQNLKTGKVKKLTNNNK